MDGIAGMAIMVKLASETQEAYAAKLSLVIVAILLDTADNLSTDRVINVVGLW